ncbi:MAG TPA: hypothetical protein VNO55_29780 [Polyangia bacterium]|nr:hypothetical protein [Polyangia bacterium]
MRTTRVLLGSLLAVLFTHQAAAQQVAPAPTTSTAPAEELAVSAEPGATPALPMFGLMMDAGLPDGMNGSLIIRPTRWLRTHVGGSYNMISSGVRAGVALLPFGSGPSLTLEGGHYFDGNANGVAKKFAGPSFKDNALLERIGYDYANAHLGIDFGSQRVTFYIHGGMSFIRATVHNVDTVVQQQAGSSGLGGSDTTVSIKQDPVIKAWTPSAKLGLIVYLW